MDELAAFFVWNPNPSITIAGRALRIYSICFFFVFVVGYVVWHWQMARGGHALRPTTRCIPWAAAGVIVGGRLAHCLFYEPEVYLRHPLLMLDFTRGGLASHGSALGLILGMAIYARRHEYSFVEMLDRMSIGAVLAASLVRLGNFFNSEIVGREFWGAWAVRFPQYAARLQREWEATEGPLGFTARALPRHPAQLYEGAGMVVVFLIVLAVDLRLGGRRPRGLLFGLVIALYFAFRFGIEQAKEYQRFRTLAPDFELQVIRVVPADAITLGQWLSIPFALFGVAFAVWAVRAGLPASLPSRFDERRRPR